MVLFPNPDTAPFRQDGASLARGKFEDPDTTREGAARAHVPLHKLETLWFNTGTLCNLACAHCYIESSPTNDALVYLTKEDVAAYLDEIEATGLGTSTIGLTGGEPFMNSAMLPILQDCLGRGHEVLVLTNAMRPMMRSAGPLSDLINRYRERLLFRVSLDHHTEEVHEAERGQNTWQRALEGLEWLRDQKARCAVAGRQLAGESLAEAKEGYRRLFTSLRLDINAEDPAALVLFPEMDETLDTPEITEQCWDILSLQKSSVMCSSSRMVVKRKGETTTRVAACTLLPYDPQFDMGQTLAEAASPVRLNHPHCSRFCVLGGASCSG